MTIFDVPVIAQGVRNFVIWIPMILRMTLITIVSGISLSIHNFGKALERYRRRHEHTHSFE